MSQYPYGNLQAYRNLDVKFTYEGLKALLLAEDKKNQITKETHVYTVKDGDFNINPVGTVITTRYDFISRKLGEYDHISYDRIEDQIRIMYHNTCIAVLYPNGTVAFNPLQDCRRNETKKRLDHIAGHNGGAVYRKDFVWYISGTSNGTTETAEYGLNRWKCDGLNNGCLMLIDEKNEIYKDLPLR